MPRRRVRRTPPQRPVLRPDQVLTPKQATFVTEYVGNGGNVQAAGEAAGVSPATAFRYSKNADVLWGIQEAYERAGIGPDKIASVIGEGMEANRIMLLPDGHGGVTEKAVPDHLTRLRAAKLLMDVTVKMRALDLGTQTNADDRIQLPQNLSDMDSMDIARIVVQKVTLRRGG